MTTSTLVDTNVLIDLLGPRTRVSDWSATALRERLEAGRLVLNTIVWSELAGMARSEETLRRALSWLDPKYEPIPWDAAYAAGLAHAGYRRNGGSRERTLPDFLIGAHAAVGGYVLLTRNAARYRSYFPGLEIKAPEGRS